MCRECLTAFDDLWPELTAEERGIFLWEATAFPVGNNTREQLEHFVEACGKDFGAVLKLADEELDAAMRETSAAEGSQ